jgi:hypothetical protein
MSRTYLAVIPGSIWNVGAGLLVAFPVVAILTLSFGNATPDPRELLAATSTIFSITSLCAGFGTAWGAGNNNEVRNGVLSAALCVIMGFLSLVLKPVAYILIPLCVISPIFGGIGGYCRMVVRMRQGRSTH